MSDFTNVKSLPTHPPFLRAGATVYNESDGLTYHKSRSSGDVEPVRYVPYASFVARVEQPGDATDPVVSVVYQNELGAEPEASRTGVGVYRLTWPLDTMSDLSPCVQATLRTRMGTEVAVAARNTGDAVELVVLDAAGAAVDGLDAIVELRVYSLI